MSRYWYYYDGSGDVNDPTNYLRRPYPANICTDGPSLCAIYSHPNPLNKQKPLGQDVVSETLQAYIIDGTLAGGVGYPITPKPFVYFRNPNP